MVDQEATAFERLGTGFTGQTIVGAGLERGTPSRLALSADGLAAVTGSDDANRQCSRGWPAICAARSSTAARSTPREVHRQLGMQTIAPLTWGSNASANCSVLPTSTRR